MAAKRAYVSGGSTARSAPPTPRASADDRGKRIVNKLNRKIQDIELEKRRILHVDASGKLRTPTAEGRDRLAKLNAKLDRATKQVYKAEAAIRRMNRPAASSLAGAFDASPGARNNFVKLSDLRSRMGGTREHQDAAIQKAVAERKVTLEVHEGVAGTLTDEMKAASIRPSRGVPFVYIMKR